MASANKIFMVYACLAVLCISGIGIFISEGSSLGIFACIIGTVIIMGVGFNTKRKLRKNEHSNQ
ncbi:MAG TPA: YlaF family protein [Bacillus sp. (in: firmicutes)]|uniref:YlaF family protein n=1 Tax=Bacillus litorisediminis TaxID=2922713 RepID=UPI001FAD5FA4|nr:YlaF family protein [Bacillus litorisediminis]HWO74848.1 YlaF family protein [Bacillus sp. (in: firmicutes)]